MIAQEVIISIANIAKTIYDYYQRAKANDATADELMRRIDIITRAVEPLQKLDDHQKVSFIAALDEINQLLEEIFAYITSLNAGDSTFKKLKNVVTSKTVQENLQKFSQKIADAIDQLNLGISAKHIQSSDQNNKEIFDKLDLLEKAITRTFPYHQDLNVIREIVNTGPDKYQEVLLGAVSECEQRLLLEIKTLKESQTDTSDHQQLIINSSHKILDEIQKFLFAEKDQTSKQEATIDLLENMEQQIANISKALDIIKSQQLNTIEAVDNVKIKINQLHEDNAKSAAQQNVILDAVRNGSKQAEDATKLAKDIRSTQDYQFLQMQDTNKKILDQNVQLLQESRQNAEIFRGEHSKTIAEFISANQQRQQILDGVDQLKQQASGIDTLVKDFQHVYTSESNKQSSVLHAIQEHQSEQSQNLYALKQQAAQQLQIMQNMSENNNSANLKVDINVTEIKGSVDKIMQLINANSDQNGISKRLLKNLKDITVTLPITTNTSYDISFGKCREMPVIIYRYRAHSEKEYAELKQRVQIPKHLTHENIAAFRGVAIDDQSNTVTLLVEHCEHGPLEKTLAQPLTNQQKNKIAIGIAKGLKYLHEEQFFHRHLSDQAILVDEHYNAKLSDLALSKDITGEFNTISATTVESVSEYYKAPELFQSKNNATCHSDIYSFGCLLWQLFSGKRPFQGYKTYQIWAAHDEGNYESLENIPAEYAILIKLCWEKAPHARPSVNEVISHLEILNHLGANDNNSVRAILTNTIVQPKIGNLATQQGEKFARENQLERAYSCFMLGAQNNDPNACFSLGAFHLDPKKGKQDIHKAISYFDKALQYFKDNKNISKTKRALAKAHYTLASNILKNNGNVSEARAHNECAQQALNGIIISDSSDHTIQTAIKTLGQQVQTLSLAS